jgi:hypothetical protein
VTGAAGLAVGLTAPCSAAWLAGALVEALGVEAALGCAPAFAAAGLLIALAARRSLAPPRPT